MAPLQLSMAMWDYEQALFPVYLPSVCLKMLIFVHSRAKAIQDGRVKIEGVDLNFLNLRVEETFFRQLRHQEFDISELSLSSYVLTLNSDDPPFIALPIFPSRFFRHQSIYVSKKAGIIKPEDLRGKRAACPEWQMTAPVWQRGIIAEHYGVKPEDFGTWYTGAVEPSNVVRKEKLKVDLPFEVQAIKPGQCLSQMLATGEIDVLFSATKPSSLGISDNVDFLFPNFKEVEMEYLKKTGIHPIMHVTVIKRSLLKQHPWLARSITKAFEEAMEYAYEAITERGALRYILPWLEDHVLETKKAFGSDRWWQDGLKENYCTVEKFLEYSHSQHLAHKLWRPEEIFASSASESFVI